MKSLKTSLIISITFLGMPFLYLANIYSSLPQTVPTHFNMKGEPDDYSSKFSLVIIISLLSLLALGIFFLLRNIHKIDPRKSAQSMPGTMNKFALAIVVFIALLNAMIVSSALNAGFGKSKIVWCLVGLFFAYLGNLMYSIKPNYFVGIRLPWTLENKDNWRKTHQLAGKMWFVGGFLIAALAFFIKAETFPFVMIIVLTIITIIPSLYSFMEFKKYQKNQL